MKKLIIILTSVLITSCCTPSIILDDVHGTVENIAVSSYKKGYKYQMKVWCLEKQKYYTVYTNHLYQVGNIIKIK